MSKRLGFLTFLTKIYKVFSDTCIVDSCKLDDNRDIGV